MQISDTSTDLPLDAITTVDDELAEYAAELSAKNSHGDLFPLLGDRQFADGLDENVRANPEEYRRFNLTQAETSQFVRAQFKSMDDWHPLSRLAALDRWRKDA